MSLRETLTQLEEQKARADAFAARIPSLLENSIQAIDGIFEDIDVYLREYVSAGQIEITRSKTSFHDHTVGANVETDYLTIFAVTKSVTIRPNGKNESGEIIIGVQSNQLPQPKYLIFVRPEDNVARLVDAKETRLLGDKRPVFNQSNFEMALSNVLDPA